MWPEALHVAYKKYKIKRKFTFFGKYQYISSRELKTLEFSLVRIVKILMFSNNSMKYIWYSPKKSKYALFITSGPFHDALFGKHTNALFW